MQTTKKVNYKFGLYVGENIVSERIFDADVYNPANRYKVELRPLNQRIIAEFRNILATPNQYLTFKISVGADANNQRRTYRLNEYRYASENEEVSAETFKYALKISDSSKESDDFIIERNFSVKNFNRNSLHSLNIVQKVDDWAYDIQDIIKRKDQNQMWDEYELLNKTQLNISDIRSLSVDAKEELLFKVNKR
jgi:hypothetical protein